MVKKVITSDIIWMMVPSDDDEHENENGHDDKHDSDDDDDDDDDNDDDNDDDSDDGLLCLFPYLLPIHYLSTNPWTTPTRPPW